VRSVVAYFWRNVALALTSSDLTEAFHKRFTTDSRPVGYRAPGRVNLMGEHTDYNNGLVLPMALEMACYAAVAAADHGKLRVYSANLNDTREWPTGSIATAEPKHDWGDYVLGVAFQLVHSGYAISPSDLYIASEVPGGAGLSSSASIEVATAMALLGSRPMEKLEIATLCQRAESQFVGMPCGIMDQYASVFGKKHAAIEIDCRDLSSETVSLPENIQVIVANSKVKHELGTSAYRQRVAECKDAVAAIKKHKPSVNSLRDVSLEDLKVIEGGIPAVPFKRARHVVTDNARVLQFAEAARKSDLEEMGRLFVASHRSARDDYEISCEELDFLIDEAVSIEGVYGARMTGGGFGGCTVNLVSPQSADQLESKLTQRYEERFQIMPLFYQCVPAEGAGAL
jgi:galactokinase